MRKLFGALSSFTWARATLRAIARSNGRRIVRRGAEEANSRGPAKCIRLDQRGRKWKFGSWWKRDERGGRERAEGGLQLLPGTRTNEIRGMGMLREARRLRLEIDEEAKRARFLSIT